MITRKYSGKSIDLRQQNRKSSVTIMKLTVSHLCKDIYANALMVKPEMGADKHVRHKLTKLFDHVTHHKLIIWDLRS